MNYREARDYIEEASHFGIVPGLNAIRELLRRLGDPQKKTAFIHVAGTNGKGSTAAFLSQILAEAGYFTGRFISPAVFGYRERIQLQDRERSRYISREAVARWMGRLKEAAGEMERDGFPHPTAFELETAMAFLEFADSGCNPVVMEVGLGGRLDATNVIEAPICSVITAIGLDHMQLLGNSLAQIAAEKAGIIKKGCPAVSYDQAAETGRGWDTPDQVIRETCAREGAPLKTADFSRLFPVRRGLSGTCFDYKDYRDLEIRLLGEFQPRNAATALEAVEVLRQNGYPVSEEAIRQGLSKTRWRGRFDVVTRQPLVIADGAHNEPAAAALAATVRRCLAERPVICVMGVLADKDYRSVLRRMLPILDVLIAITPKNARGLSSALLKRAAEEESTGMPGEGKRPEILDGETVDRGLSLAEKKRGGQGAVLAFGSLSFLSEVYAFYGEA